MTLHETIQNTVIGLLCIILFAEYNKLIRNFPTHMFRYLDAYTFEEKLALCKAFYEGIRLLLNLLLTLMVGIASAIRE